MSEGPVSSTRLYLGNLPQNATKADIEEHFRPHGNGEIMEVKLMNGFGFIEFKDSMDARDVVPAYHGSDFKGNRLIVQFAKGNRPKEMYHQERAPPRPRRTVYRMSITGIPGETSWQDLKDFARQSGLDPVYSEVSRERDGKGFVEYETEADLNTAVEKLDGTEFKDQSVTCVADIQPERPRERYRSRSPPGRYDRRGPPRGWNDYDRRGPPSYRDRTPPPPRRGYYDERDRYPRSPPPDYPPPRRMYPDEQWAPRGGYPPARPYEPEPYPNGRSYERPPSPGRRPRSPVRYDAQYDRRPYW